MILPEGMSLEWTPLSQYPQQFLTKGTVLRCRVDPLEQNFYEYIYLATLNAYRAFCIVDFRGRARYELPDESVFEGKSQTLSVQWALDNPASFIFDHAEELQALDIYSMFDGEPSPTSLEFLLMRTFFDSNDSRDLILPSE